MNSIYRKKNNPAFSGESANTYNKLVCSATQGQLKIETFNATRIKGGEGVIVDSETCSGISYMISASANEMVGEMENLLDAIIKLSEEEFQLSSSFPKIQNVISEIRCDLNLFKDLNQESSKVLNNYNDAIQFTDKKSNLSDANDTINATVSHVKYS